MSRHSKHSATTQRPLREGQSVWRNSPFTHVPTRQLEASRKADVIIVGAGISGAFMAHALSKLFDSVVVVDRRPPVEGSTMASTAMLQFEIDVPLTKLSEQIGAKRAKRAWLRSWQATRQLAQLIETENMRCGYQARDALYLSGGQLGHRGLIAECEARNLAGIPADYLTAAMLRERFSIDREGAIQSPDCGSANPVQLAAGLLRRAAARSVPIYSPVEIKAVMATGHGIVLDAGDHFLESKVCIFCTGYELLKGVPREGIKIISSWAMATGPNADYPAWLDKILIWEANDPYLYLRTTPDRRILVGGEDEDTDSASYRARLLDRKSRALVRKVRKLIPDAEFKAEKRWAGAFGESDDGLPIIDEVPGMPGCYTVMGIGGNGTIFSFIASQIVSQRLKGRRDVDSDLFGFR